jgi:hypothetical protein
MAQREEGQAESSDGTDQVAGTDSDSYADRWLASKKRPETTHCPHCGSKMPYGSRMCVYCMGPIKT